MHTGTRLDQRQHATLSPRLQHAVRLLQLSSLDFAQEIRSALERNPFLETDEADADTDAATERNPAAAAGDAPAGGVAALDAAGILSDEDLSPAPPEATSVDDAPADAGEADIDRESWLAAGSSGASRGDDAQVSALDLMPADDGLRAHLHRQLGVAAMPLRDLLLAKAVVESLDDDGYLRVPLDELLEDTGLEPAPNADELRIALRRVQSLEPAGVGARSVGECLLLQLPAIVCPQQRALVQRIVAGHLDDLAAKNLGRIARELERSPADVLAACERIRRLDPRPGWRFGANDVHYVTPDVVVKKHRREWKASLNPAIVPRVRMNHLYAEMFRQHRQPQNGALATQLQEARWTMRNVEQRFSTILDVAQAIVKRQSRFLELGPLAMRPLGLREIADEVGLHESTVSRVTNNKYIATPSGVFELKYFFSRAMTATHGATYSGTAIRELVKEMIDGETADAPLSDAQIARMLARQGLGVARRTVTKYRQALRIESVERRRAPAVD